MTDEELAEIEGQLLWCADIPMTVPKDCVRSLIAEVRSMADRLNRQAKDLEVLREWIRDCGKQMIRDEKEIIDDPEFSTPEDVDEGKRRIAALGGK